MSGRTHGKVFSFDLKFRGSKRTSFYRKLFGFHSKTKKEDSKGITRVYESFYPGLLTSIPYLKLGKSVIAVPKLSAGKLRSFFNNPEWGPINLYVFTGIFQNKDRMKAMNETLNRVRVTRDTILKSEIKALIKAKSQNNINSTDFPRIRRILKSINKLERLDWTDNKEFSRNINDKINPLKNIVEI